MDPQESKQESLLYFIRCGFACSRLVAVQGQRERKRKRKREKPTQRVTDSRYYAATRSGVFSFYFQTFYGISRPGGSVAERKHKAATYKGLAQDTRRGDDTE